MSIFLLLQYQESVELYVMVCIPDSEKGATKLDIPTLARGTRGINIMYGVLVSSTSTIEKNELKHQNPETGSLMGGSSWVT